MEYCDILLKAKDYKYLYDFKLAKSEYDIKALSFRYENSICLLRSILKRYRINGYKAELTRLSLVYGSNLEVTDETIQMLDLIYNNFKEVLNREIHNRFD